MRGEDCVAHPTRRHILGFASLALPALLGGCGAGAAVGRLTASWFDDLEPGGDGYALYRVRRGDTLIDLAPRYRIGYVELAAANPGVDPWQPAPGTKLAIPTTRLAPRGRRKGLVVNLADMRLYHFPGGAPRATTRSGSAGTGTRPRSAPRVWSARPWPRPGIRHRGCGPRSRTYRRWSCRARTTRWGGHALYLGWPTYLIPRDQPAGQRRPACEQWLPQALRGAYRGAPCRGAGGNAGPGRARA